jgi:hypothetical protein
MFIRHKDAFAETTQMSVALPKTDHVLALTANTVLETPFGFEEARNLKAGDQVASLDGGFVTITGAAPLSLSGQGVVIPAGVLGVSETTCLPAEAYVGLTPENGTIFEAPYLAAPAHALAGYKGIEKGAFEEDRGLVLTFGTEELIWAQNGMLLHAFNPRQSGFFERLDYGQTRALLASMDPLNHGPDQVATQPRVFCDA